MYYQSPELVDELLMSRAMNKGAAPNESNILARHAAMQGANRNIVQSAGNALNIGNQQLDLNRQRLAQNQQDFNGRMDISRQRLQSARRDTNAANLLAAGGLGVSFLTDRAAQTRHQQQMEAVNGLIKKYESAGNANGMFYSDMLKAILQGVK